MHVRRLEENVPKLEWNQHEGWCCAATAAWWGSCHATMRWDGDLEESVVVRGRQHTLHQGMVCGYYGAMDKVGCYVRKASRLG